MYRLNNTTELSSPGGTRGEFNRSQASIKLGIDVHQEFYVVVLQEGGTSPKPGQRLSKATFLLWARKLREQGREVYAVYEACGFGFGLQRALSQLGITCHVVTPQKLDERRQRVKTDARDAKALCLKLSRYVEGNTAELALVRVPTEEEEQARALHRQREQLVRTRKQLEAQGRSLLVEQGIEPGQGRWWKGSLAKLELPSWLEERLGYWQPLLLLLEKQIRALTLELEKSAAPNLPRGLGRLSSVLMAREVCDWNRFRNRRQVGSYTGLCPGVYSSGQTRRLSCVKWRHLLGQGALASGPARKKAIVALARQLAIDLWRIHTGRVTPQELGLI